MAGIKGYEISRSDLTAQQTISAYRQLLHIEKAFRMSKSNFQARPIYHHTPDSIKAHLSIVQAALAVGHELEHRSELSLKRLVRTLRRYRSFTLAINNTTIHAAIPLPPETAELITKLEKPD